MKFYLEGSGVLKRNHLLEKQKNGKSNRLSKVNKDDVRMHHVEQSKTEREISHNVKSKNAKNAEGIVSKNGRRSVAKYPLWRTHAL